MQSINPTREALMDLAEELMQTRSFANMSFQTLAKGVGIKKGSVYYHFESKEELGEAILDRAAELLRSGLEAIRSEPVVKQLHVYTNWFGKHIGAGHRLCPGANIVASWDAVPEPMKRKVQALYRIHKQGLIDIIERGRASGDFAASDLSPDEMATAVFSMLQGGLMASRVAEDAGQFAACKAAALHLVKQG